jgi:hypothetical protein
MFRKALVIRNVGLKFSNFYRDRYENILLQCTNNKTNISYRQFIDNKIILPVDACSLTTQREPCQYSEK